MSVGKALIALVLVGALGGGIFAGYQKVTAPEPIRTIELPIDGQADLMEWLSFAFGEASKECIEHPDAEEVRFTFTEAGQQSGMARQYYANIEEMPGAVNCSGVPGSEQYDG